MRASVSRSLALLSIAAVPLTVGAQDHGAGAPPNLLEPHGGLMVWTLAIFIILMFVLSRFAFRPLLAAVEAREQALEHAIEGARRDREEAAKLLEEQRKLLESSRGEAQRLLTEGRGAAEKMRTSMLEQTKQQQQELLERAKRDIEAEKERAITQLRKEAVDLAIAGASRVIERNLDDQANRKLIESFLSSIPAGAATGNSQRGSTGR